MTLLHGDAFAGIGGFGLAARDIGWSTVWACEIEKFCREIYETRLGNDALRFDSDIRYARDIPRIDILTAGFPCQDLSVAGLRLGFAGGVRSSLFYHLARILHAARPEWSVFENVPGLLSSAEGRDMQSVLHGITGACPTMPASGWGNAGFCIGPAYAVAWRVLDSRFFGVAQRRRRVFFVGHSSSDFRVPCSILFERGGGARNPSSRRGSRNPIAHAITSRTHKAGDPTSDTYVSLPLKSGGNSRHDATHETYVGALDTHGRSARAEDARDGRIILAHTLRAEGADASEDGSGRGTPICIQDARAIRKDQFSVGIRDDGTSFTLDGVSRHAVAQQAYTLRWNERTTAIQDARTTRSHSAENQRGEVRLMDDIGALSSADDGRPGHSYPAVACPETLTNRVRDSSGLPSALDLCPSDEEGPDAPRYRALGNAITVNVAQWIFRRIEAYRLAHA